MLAIHRKDLLGAAAAAAAVLLIGVAATELAGRFAGAVAAAACTLAVLAGGTFLYRRILARCDDNRTLVEASLSLLHALRPEQPLPPLRGYALAADSALLLHGLLRAQKPRVVVETGSGVSSLIIGYALKAQGGGRLLSLELDEGHARRTRELVTAHGLAPYVTVVHAPLREVTVDGRRHVWHDPTALAGLGTIDFVLDDGPPRDLGPGLRTAALPLLLPRLAPDAVYLLNYVAREERRMVAGWLASFPELGAEWVPSWKGNVVLRRSRPVAQRPAARLAGTLA